MSEFEDKTSDTDLFVRNLRDVGERELKNLFQPYGLHQLIYKDTFAIVKVKSKDMADAIIRTLKDQPPYNLHIERAKRKSTNRQMLNNKENVQRFTKRDKPQFKRSINSDVRNNEMSSDDSRSEVEFVNEAQQAAIVMTAYTIQNCDFTLKEFVVKLAKFYVAPNSKIKKRDQHREGLVEKLSKVFDEFSMNNLGSSEVKQSSQFLNSNSNDSFDRQNGPTTKNVESWSQQKYEDDSPKFVKNTRSDITLKADYYSKSNTSAVNNHQSPRDVTPKLESFVKVTEAKAIAPSPPSRCYSVFLSPCSTVVSLGMKSKYKNGIVVFALDTADKSMSAKYASLFDEFATCCKAVNKDVSATGDGSMVAIEESADVWYRAFKTTDGFALIDEGCIIPVDKPLRVIPCPEKFMAIPEFTCHLTFDPVVTNDSVNMTQSYFCEITSKDTSDSTLFVKILDFNKKFLSNGLIKLWKCSVIKNESMSVPQNAVISPLKPQENRLFRKSILDVIGEGDELAFNIIAVQILGQVCFLVNKRCPEITTQYQSLFQQLADACEKEEESPLVPNKVMAIKSKADQSWYRAIHSPRGLALVDVGSIMSPNDIVKSVICPEHYDKVPEFCTLLTNVIPLTPNTNYNVKILEKDTHNRKTKVQVSNPSDPSFVMCQGFMRPYFEFLGETQRMASLAEEEARASKLLAPVKMSALQREDIKPGDTVIIVSHIKDRVYLRKCDEQSQKVYMKLLDRLLCCSKYGAMSRVPDNYELVVCKIEDKYHRAIVEAYNASTKTCKVKFIDTGDTRSVDCDQLVNVSFWAVKIPVMTGCYALSGVDGTFMNSNATVEYLSSHIKKETHLKCVQVSSNGVLLQALRNRENINESIEDMNTPEWKKIVSRNGILKEPPIMDVDVELFNIAKGSRIKFLEAFEWAITVTVDDDHSKSKLESLTKRFSEYCDTVKDHYTPRLNELFLYRDPKTKTWRRGIALDIRRSDLTFSSMDYGTMESVKISECRKMLKEFVQPLPALAVICIVNELGRDSNEAIFKKAVQIIREMDTLVVESARYDDQTYYICNLKIRGLADRL